MRPERRDGLPAAVPELPVRDLDSAVGYYRDALGFTIDWVEQAIGLAGLSRGDCRLFLADPGFRAARGTTGPALAWINLDGKAQVDALYAEWSGRAARVADAPESKPYGLHEFTAQDLDGNHLRIFYDFATPERRGA